MFGRQKEIVIDTTLNNGPGKPPADVLNIEREQYRAMQGSRFAYRKSASKPHFTTIQFPAVNITLSVVKSTLYRTTNL